MLVSVSNGRWPRSLATGLAGAPCEPRPASVPISAIRRRSAFTVRCMAVLIQGVSCALLPSLLPPGPPKQRSRAFIKYRLGISASSAPHLAPLPLWDQLRRIEPRPGNLQQLARREHRAISQEGAPDGTLACTLAPIAPTAPAAVQSGRISREAERFHSEARPPPANQGHNGYGWLRYGYVTDTV